MRENLHGIVLTIILIFYISVDGLAQVNISGKVVEKGSGEPLPFASVTIKGSTVGVATNIDGFLACSMSHLMSSLL
ncbi:MAG: carboxypeptidase-like regulatory domain-containing protein [Bacteroidota bacterium]